MTCIGQDDTKLVIILVSISKALQKMDTDLSDKSPNKKKSKKEQESLDPTPEPKKMVDSSTSMDLTPC